MNRHENRCANTEALGRYEREVDECEKIYEIRCGAMNEELAEVIEQYEEIAKRYELQDEAKEYMKDML